MAIWDFLKSEDQKKAERSRKVEVQQQQNLSNVLRQAIKTGTPQQKRAAQTLIVNRASTPAKTISRPIQSFTERVRDVLDSNSSADYYRRSLQNQTPVKQSYRDQQIALGNTRPYENLGAQILGNSARFANTGSAAVREIQDTAKMYAAQATNNQEAYGNAVRENELFKNTAYKPDSGLLGAGTIFNNRQEFDTLGAKDLTKRVGATTIGAMSELAPMARVGRPVMAGGKVVSTQLVKGTAPVSSKLVMAANAANSSAKMPTRLAYNAVEGALSSGAESTARQYSQTGKVDPKTLLGDTLAGTVLNTSVAGITGKANQLKKPTTNLVKDIQQAGRPTGQALQALKVQAKQIDDDISNLMMKRSRAELTNPELVPVFDERINAKYAELDSVKKSMNSRNQSGYVRNPLYKDNLDPLMEEARKFKTADDFIVSKIGRTSIFDPKRAELRAIYDQANPKAPVVKTKRPERPAEPERWIAQKPIKMPAEVYRGVGKDGGTGMSMYGSGLYTAAGRKEAAKYGKVSKLGAENLPRNPLQFKTDLDFKQWQYEMAKKLGVDRKDLYGVDEGVEKLVKPLGYDGITIGQGRDMIAVKYGETPSAPPKKSPLQTFKDINKSKGQGGFVRNPLVNSDGTPRIGKGAPIEKTPTYIEKIRQPIEKELKDAQAEMDKYGTGYINDIDLAAKQARAKARLDKAKEADWQNSPDKILARKENGEAAFRESARLNSQIAAAKDRFNQSEPWYKAREVIKSDYISKFKNADDFVSVFNSSDKRIPTELKHQVLEKYKNLFSGSRDIEAAKKTIEKDLADFYNEAKPPTPPKTVAPKGAPIEKTPEVVTFNGKPHEVVGSTKIGRETKYQLRDADGKEIWTNQAGLDTAKKTPTLQDALEGKSTKIPKQVNTLERPLDIPKRVSVEKPSLGNARQEASLKVQSSPLLPKDTPRVVKPKSQSVPPKTPPTKQVSSYSNNTPELPEYNTKRVSLLDKAFRSTRSIIERQGESGKKLAGMLQNQRDTKELWIRDIEKRLPTVQKLKTKEFENFVEATQGNTKPLNSKVESAIKEWQSVHPEIRQRGVDAGLEIGDLGETYYPHFIDYDKIYKDKNTYNQAINHLVKTGQAETPEKAIELLGYARDLSRNREFGNLEASRIIDLPFYDRSKASLGAYLQGSSDRITKAEMFGKGDEKALKLIKKIGVEGGDTEAAKNAFDVAVGAKKFNPTTSKISSGIRHYTTVTRLGLGALTNVSQSVNTGIVTGHMNTLKAVVKQLDPKTRQMAADTGVISDAIIQDLRRGFGQETFGSSKAGKAVNFITAPGFKQVESFNRRVAATAGRDYALRLAQKGDEKTLRKLGVTGEIKNGTLTTAQQTQAARKVVEKTQFKVDPQDLPGWTASPGGKLVSQFRTFSYSQGKFFSNEILKPAAKGNLMPLARLMAALPLGYGLYEVRRQIDGRPEEENKVKVGLQSWGKVGGAGLVLDLYQGLNPVGSKYLPSDRRVSMAVGTVGGPSVGTAANAVGALSEAIQRKRTPDDPSRLGGKVVVGNTGDMYTDLTPAARLAMQQIPIVGTPIMNRVLPYKKQSDSDIGKKDQPDFNSKMTLDESKEFVKKRIENAFGKDIASLNQDELKELAKTDSNAKEALQMYTNNTGAFGAGGKISDKLKNETARKILDQSQRTTNETWGTKPTTQKEAADSLQSWLPNYKLPTITNNIAKEWALYKQKEADGTLGKLEAESEKKTILRSAFNSQLNEDEKDLYQLSEANLKDAYERGVINDENINKALAVEKQLFDAGLISKETLARKLDLKARGYKSGKRGSGSKSLAKKYQLFGFGDPKSTTTSLRKLLEQTQS